MKVAQTCHDIDRDYLQLVTCKIKFYNPTYKYQISTLLNRKQTIVEECLNIANATRTEYKYNYNKHAQIQNKYID